MYAGSFNYDFYRQVYIMSKNKKRRKPGSEAQRRRKRIAAARFRAVLAVCLIIGAVALIVKLGNSTEAPLVINAENYYQIKEVEEEDPELLEDVDESVSVNADMSKYVVARPKLREEYPIDMNIRSEYAIVYDVQADEVLYSKNAEEKCYPASTTKILTSAVILDTVPEDFMFTAGDELDFVHPESSLAFVNKGNILDLETTIDAIMLPSGNDAAYMAAANVGRYILDDEDASAEEAVEIFVDTMNRTAKLVGAENTHFSDPDGFHDDDHYTTALDMLKITLYAKDKPLLKAAGEKPSRYAVFASGEEAYWDNSNKLILENSDCYYMYANGLKTGMTDQSGYCVVATARRFDHDVICIVFGAEASDIRWNDTIALLDAAFVQVRNRNGD